MAALNVVMSAFFLKQISRCLFLLAVACCGADIKLPEKPTSDEKAFVAAIDQAIQKKDVDTLLAIDYSEDLPGSKHFLRDFYKEMITKGCTLLSLERVNPAKATQHSEGSEIVRENLPVHWVLTVTHPSTIPGATVTSVLRVGTLGGKMRFTNSRAIKPPKNSTPAP